MISGSEPVRAVAFDVDGTLYPNSRMYARSIPFALTHLRLIAAYARVRKDIRTIRPIEDFPSLERKLLSKEMGVSEAKAASLIEKEIHGQWESVFDRVPPYPHVRTVVQALKDAGILVAAASDFPLASKLKRLGLHDLFACQLWSANSGYLKPHPEPFAAIIDCFKVPAESIVYVGNSYEYDVIGARASGMRSAHVARRPARRSIADFTFIDYRDLLTWITTINRQLNHS